MTEAVLPIEASQIYFKNKQQFMHVVVLLVGLTAFFYGIGLYFFGKKIVGVTDLIVSALMALLYITKNRVSFEARAQILAIIMLAFLSFLVIDGATGNVGFVWMMLYPSIIFYLSGVKRGTMWMTVGQLVLVGLAIAYVLGWIHLPYAKIVMFQINACYFVLAILTYFAEKDRLTRTQTLIDVQQKEAISRQELTKKLTELEALNARMDENESHSQTQKISLEDTKRAMINLLDDARELEEELKTEKAGVEKKIIERTQELQAKTSALEKAREETTKGWLQLQAEKAKLNASVEAIPVGLVMIDTRHQILIGNTTFKKIIGLEETAIIDQSHPQSGKQFLSIFFLDTQGLREFLRFYL